MILLSLGGLRPAGAVDVAVSVHAAPELNGLFRTTNGWIGGDAAYSLTLRPDTTLWLFGDSIIGEVRAGQRVNATMIHNAVALQRRGQAPDFFHGTNAAGKAEALFQPADGAGYLWPLAGVRERWALQLFMSRVHATKPDSVWGFDVSGISLVTVTNPDDPPPQWKTRAVDLPFSDGASTVQRQFGWAALNYGDFTYIYGSVNRAGKRVATVIARAPLGKLGQLSTWRFLAVDEWQPDFRRGTPICEEAPPEGSVSWQPALKKFVMIYMNDLSPRINLRTAATPSGPWSAPQTIYQCAETTSSVFCYAGKAHPELSGPRELVLTYADNSTNFSDLFKTDALYWPKFVTCIFP
ncbi:MAG TPA: DUF4185 domain-containing protein [Verrucomicrobiae bacterium]|nr:DUF4185 domain-containing protein [Verrucomicrobiae bacterium]